MEKALHEKLEGLPMAIQELIIEDAMNQYIQFIHDEYTPVTAYQKWAGYEDRNLITDLGITPWKPFDGYEGNYLFDLVESGIYAGADHARKIIDILVIPDLLVALQRIAEQGFVSVPDLTREEIIAIAASAIAKAKAKGEL